MKKLLILTFILLSAACGGSGSPSASNVTTPVNNPSTSSDPTLKDTIYFEEELADDDDQLDDGRYYDIINLGEITKGSVLEVYYQSLNLETEHLHVFDPYLALGNTEAFIEQNDDGGLLGSAYINITIPKTDAYNLMLTSLDPYDTGDWQLWFLIRSPENASPHYVLFDPEKAAEEENEDDSSYDGSSDDTCHSQSCGICGHFNYFTCSCQSGFYCDY